MKFKTLLFLAGIFIFSSCGEDSLSERIIGTWNLTSVERSGCDNPNEIIPFTIPDTDGCFEADGDILCNVGLRFTSNETAVLSYSDDNNDIELEEYTYTVNDEDETITLCEASNDCTTITVTDNELSWIITGSGCTQETKFKKS